MTKLELNPQLLASTLDAFAAFLATRRLSSEEISIYRQALSAFISENTLDQAISLEETTTLPGFHQTAAFYKLSTSQAEEAWSFWQEFASLQVSGNSLAVAGNSVPITGSSRSSLSREELLHRYELAMKADKRSQSTIKNYLADLRAFFDAFGNQASLDFLTKPNVLQYLESLEGQLAPGTIERKTSTLRQFFAWAKLKGYVSSNPLELTQYVQAGVNTLSAPQPKRRLPGFLGSYLTWRLTPYFHLALMMVFISLLTFGAYKQFVLNVSLTQAYPTTLTRPNRILSFQARLANTNGSPITGSTPMTFRLYDASGGGTNLWSGSCTVSPDANGIFSVLLGDTCGAEIDSSVFSENAQVWLEVQVDGEVLSPRQRIATVAYSLNSETLQGYPPATPAQINTIPVIDNTGSLIIGAASPTLQSTTGTFAVKANALVISTNTGTGGNITIAPDGTGQVQVLGGTTTSDTLTVSNANLTTGNLITGTVANNNTGYKFLSFQGGSSPTEKFSVNAVGNVVAVGTYTGRGAILTATSTSDVPLQVNGTGGNVLSVTNSGDITLATGANIKPNTNSTTAINIANAANTRFVTFDTSNSRVGIGTTSPGTALDVTGSVTVSSLNTPGGIVYDTNSSGTLGVSAAGTSGQCLVSGGTGAPTWGSCGSSTNFWRITDGALAPVNNTLDVLIGSTATASAKFGLINVNSGTPTFQIEGNSVLTSTTLGSTVVNSSLTSVGALSSGSITTGFGTISTTNTITGTTINGTTGINTGAGAGTQRIDASGNLVSINNITAGGTITFSALPTAGAVLYTASGGVVSQTAQGTSGQCLVSGGTGSPTWTSCSVASNNYWQLNDNVLSPGNSTWDLAVGGTSTASALFQVFGSGNSAGYVAARGATFSAQINTDTLLTLKGASGQTANLAQWKNSASTVLGYLGPSGDLTLGNGTAIAGNRQLTIDAAVGNAAILQFQKGTVNKGRLYEDVNNNLILESGVGQNTVFLSSGDLVGIKNTNPTAQLDVTGTASVSSTLTVPTIQPPSSALTLNYKSGPNSWAAAVTIQPITGNVGIGSSNPISLLSVGATNGFQVSSAGTITSATLNTAGGIIYAQSGGILAVSAAGTVGQCLVSGGSGTPTWTSCSSAAQNYWQNDGTTLAPANTTWNLAVGGTSTASALFLVEGLTGNASMAGTLTVSTIKPPTGPLTLQYKSGPNSWNSALTIQPVTGYVGIGTTNPTNLLHVSGSRSRLNNILVGEIAATYDLIQSLSAGGLRLNTGGNLTLETGVGEVVRVTSAGLVGIGTTAPVSTLDVRGVATISGTNANANLIVDQSGTGNILTASASGATRMTLSNTGFLTLTSLNTAGAVVYTNASGTLNVTAQGTTNQCLVSGGTGSPTWSNCNLPATFYWQLNNEVLSPGNSTWDVAVGGTSTASAKFQVFANTGNATMAGTLTVSTIQPPTDALTLNYKSGPNTWASAVTIQPTSGNVGVRTSNPGSELHVKADPNFSGNADIELETISGNNKWTMSAVESNGNFTVYDKTNNKYPLQLAANTTGSINLDVSGNVGIGTITPTAPLHVNWGYGANAAFIVNQLNSGDILTASAGGTTRMTLSNTGFLTINALNTAGAVVYTNASGTLNVTAQGTTGQCLASGGSGTPTWTTCGGVQYWQLNDNVLSPGNSTWDLAIGGTATSTAKFQVFADTGNATMAGTLTVSTIQPPTGPLTLNYKSGPNAWLPGIVLQPVTGNVGIGVTNPQARLDIGGSTSTITNTSGDITISAASGNVSLNGGNLTNFAQTLGTIGSVSAPTYSFSGDTNTGMYSGGADLLRLVTGGANRLAIDANGLVGIGTIAPTALLHVNGGYGANATLIVNQLNSGDLIAASASGTTRFRVDNSGNVIAAAFQDSANTAYFLDPASAGTALTLAGNAGIGTTAPISQLNVTGATVGKAQVIFNETGDQNILTASSSGTAVFQVGHDGDLTIGNALKTDVIASLYGDVLQKENVSLAGLTGVNAVYVYDTTKDSDYGAWTDNASARASSWYSETKDDGIGDTCNISTDDRCGQSAFPKKAVLVGTSTGFYIFDALSNKMWMKRVATGFKAWTVVKSVHALNGVVYIGYNDGSATAGWVTMLDFKKDFDSFVTTTGWQYASGSDSTIGARNTAGTAYVTLNTTMTLLNQNVNDVHAAVVQGKTYVAVASGLNTLADDTEGFTLIHVSDVKSTYFVRDSQSANDLRAKTVWLTSAGTAYLNHFDNTALGDAVNAYYNIQNDASETSIVQHRDAVYTSINTTPQLITNATESNQSIWVTESSSTVDGASNTIYFGTAAGLTVLQEKQGQESLGSVKYFKTDYITEEMAGSARGMWPLSSQLASNSGTLIGQALDASPQNNHLNEFNRPTFTPGVRGMGLNFNGSTQFLQCSDANCGGTTKLDWGGADWTVGAWIKTSTTNTRMAIISKGTTGSYSWDLEVGATNAPGAGCVNNNAGFAFYNTISGTFMFVCGGNVTDGQWHHVVATFWGGPLTLRLYIDGVLITSTTTTSGTAMTDSTAAFEIGRRNDAALYFNGTIDEPFVLGNARVSSESIRTMYVTGRKALQHQSQFQITASSATSNSITNTLQTWTPQQFVGTTVEIVSGTGAGQTRLIASNSGQLLTVTPNWTTTPVAGSVFSIRSHQLYGASNITRAVSVTDDPVSRNRFLYVGTNSGSGTGGVTKLDLNGDTVLDSYHNDAGKTDEAGNAWSTTSSNDDITAIWAASKVLSIGSSNLYWMEREQEQLTSELDRLRNDINLLKQFGDSSGPITNQTVNYAGTSIGSGYQVIRKGWGWILGNATVTLSEAVSFGITFDETPLVYSTYSGSADGNDPTIIGECNEQVGHIFTNNYAISTTGYTQYVLSADGVGISATWRACYAWMAIGTHRASFPTGSNPWPAGADLAEWYATDDTTLRAGEVVSIAKSGDIKVERASKETATSALGIISTKPNTILGDQSGLTAGYKEDEFTPGATSVAVALAGRVPVKVSLENGVIRAGDYLAPASVPGYVAKAITAGPVVGKAMEGFDGTSTITNVVTSEATESAQFSAPDKEDPSMKELSLGRGVIMAFVQNGYWDPDGGLSTGQLASTYAIEKNAATDSALLALVPYQLRNTIIGQTIEKVVTATNAMIANLEAGRIRAQEIIAKTFSIGSSTFVAQNKENGGEDLMLKLGGETASGSGISTLTIADRYSNPVITFDEQGNASFSGNLTAKSASFEGLTLNDASISGTLYADNIFGLREKVESMIADNLSSSDSASWSYLANDIYPSLTGSPSAELIAQITDTNSEVLSRIAALEAKVTDTASASGFLASSDLEGVSVSGSLIARSALTVGSTILIDSTGISSVADTLAIQGNGHGTINFLAGAMTLDATGLMVNTDAYFARSVTIKEDLMVDVIRSVNGGISIHLATPSADLTERLAILNNQNQEVANIDASGSAKFNKLIIASASQDPNSTATISGQYRTNASTGSSILPAGTRSLKIVSPKVALDSLVYVTPTSSTSNQVLYVSSKHVADALIPGDYSYFVVSLDNPLAIPVAFNWWIIN